MARVAGRAGGAERFLLTVMATLLASLLAACSSGNDPPSTAAIATSSSPPPTTVATTPSPQVTSPPTTIPTTVPAVSSVVATSPEAVTAQLVAAERTVRDDTTEPAMVDEAGRLQQLIYRTLGSEAGLADAVLASVPDDLRPFIENNLAAARAAAAAAAQRTPPPPPTLPAWTIRDPKPSDELRRYYTEAEAATGVPWHVLAAINLVETRMGRIDGVSSSGALGPMQFLPSTWAACCAGDVLDDHDAILGAATYLAAAGAATDLRRALHRYNPSETYVEMVSRYSENLRLDERSYRGYHAWQVFVATSLGAVRLPVGYQAREPVDAASYLVTHPGDRA